MKYKHLPLAGVALSLALFVVAATRYPGGTLQSPNSVGYDWSRNFLSSLFTPQALNGAPNAARPFAVVALFVMSLALALLWVRIAATASSRAHKKTIEIAGIGSAVYGFLVATPMHDLMVTIGIVFSATAMVALIHMLYIERRWSLFAMGALSLAIVGVTATMYYGHALYGALPVIQKLSVASCTGWLVCVYYARLGVRYIVPNAHPAIASE
jgi:hypothetical protein